MSDHELTKHPLQITIILSSKFLRFVLRTSFAYLITAIFFYMFALFFSSNCFVAFSISTSIAVGVCCFVCNDAFNLFNSYSLSFDFCDTFNASYEYFRYSASRFCCETDSLADIYQANSADLIAVIFLCRLDLFLLV